MRKRTQEIIIVAVYGNKEEPFVLTHRRIYAFYGHRILNGKKLSKGEDARKNFDYFHNFNFSVKFKN
jgi:hypothetical protein